ncbi:hypothetical protein GTP58_08245 [Duganella sp. CY15W]|uniref:hypothetical protein n=1 Tax=Duganella sp. CY15W TaxID=2692172 RepID=UPI00136C8FC3|nr:hypothetical protein [Duganella sp. CY15W]MYM28312.1 hypothetical protein [Duganella sp. CY15W]
MHQEAILTTNHTILGPAGTPVSIAKLEKLFTTTASANDDIGYKCADPHCGVRVKAVITVLSKKLRKNSPSSYFAAKGTSHAKGCTRMPKPATLTPLPPTSGAGAASPHRSAHPAIWVDPRTQPAAIGGSPATVTGGSGGSGGPGRVRTTSGGGTTQSRSQLVESYALAWIGMAMHEKRTEELLAEWNPGGTYFSAFHPIWFYSGTDVTAVGQKIFVGKFSSIIKSKTGYVITLAEKNSTGEPLWVWVQSHTFAAGAAGKALQQLMEACEKTPVNYVGKRVFALEKFTGNSGSKGPWSSIPVEHPHMMWMEK